MRCDGQIAVVVGGGSGIGRATAELFAANGAVVVVAGRNEQSIEETAKLVSDAGGNSSWRTCDATRLAETDALVEYVMNRYGRLDLMTTTVGGSDTTLFIEEEPDYWKHVIEMNLFSAFNICKSALGPMTKQQSGSIVLMSSDAGKVGTLGETVYAAAKAGVIGFVKSLAREVARDGIRVNAVSPGPTDTPLLRAHADQFDQKVLDKMIRVVPMKRVGQATEQAAAIVFLASDAASYITGQTLSVSGGLTMNS